MSTTTRPRVLVITDDADLRQFVMGALGERYRTEAVADVATALALSLEQTPDVILTGVMRSPLHGGGLLAALRAEPRTSGVPVIVLIADAGEDTSLDGMPRGADDFLMHPFSARELLARVAAQLRSQRRASEDALNASEERSRTILDSITDGFFALDRDWRFTFMNAAAGRSFKRAPSELIGKRLLDEYADLVGSEFERVYRRVAATRVPESFTTHYPSFDRWYDVTAYPATEGLTVYFRDVTDRLTERKRHEDSTLQALAGIVERCPFGIYIVDQDLRIASMNAGSQQGAFATVRPVIGRQFDEVVRVIWPEQVATEVLEIFQHTLTTGESYHSRDFRHARADVGQTESYEFEVHRVDMPNGRYGAACYFFDSTQLRDAERRLVEADRKKDEFLAILAHELRNPLAPLRNGVQLLRLIQGDADASARTLSMMERQVGQMVHLLDDLLDVSRISRDTISLRKERIELTSAIAQAIESSRPLIDQGGHVLVVDVPPVPLHVYGDLTRLAQVFSNVLNNAARYTPRGGHIRLTVQQLGSEAVVSVTDDGIGIPTDMLSKIFEMFTQVLRNHARPQSGLGIGLSIVKRLVDLHGGSVEARSGGDGLGSEFIVHLPVDVPDVEPAPLDAATMVGATAAHRILVVDDNVDFADSLSTLLTIMGHETRMAHDGLDALNVAAAFRPRVMLLDMGLPTLDGVEVCRRIRQQAWGKDVFVIVLSGWGQEADKRR